MHVETVANPILINNDGVILQGIASAICGYDLHIYRGKILAMKNGNIPGHEFMGVVAETGSAVTDLKKDDCVVIPFVIAWRECFFSINPCLPPAAAPTSGAVPA